MSSSIRNPDISMFSSLPVIQNKLLSHSETLTKRFVFEDQSEDGILVPYRDPSWLTRLPVSLKNEAKKIYYNENLFVIKDFPENMALQAAGRMDDGDTQESVKEYLMHLAVVCKSGSDDEESWEKSLVRDQFTRFIVQARNLHMLVLDVTDCCVPPPQEDLSEAKLVEARIQIWPEFRGLLLPLLEKLTNLQKLVIICYGKPRLIHDLNESLSGLWVHASACNGSDRRTWHTFTKCVEVLSDESGL